MKMYGDMKHYNKGTIHKNKTGKKQNSSSNSSLNTSKLSNTRNKNNLGIDYFLNTEFKSGFQSSSKKPKKKIKHKKFHQHSKIRENGIGGFWEKGNRSASPQALSISRANIKGRTGQKRNK